MTKMMSAALFDSYGPPDVLYVGKVPVPTPRPGEVLVRVHAASVNGGEAHARSGRVRLLTGNRFPQRVGLDFAGEVAVTTAGGLREGDMVWGTMPRNPRAFGSVAEYVTVRPRQIALAPSNLTPVEAVSLLAGGTTALTALRDKARLKAGERLLVRGASGGVGSVAVQYGKAFGARVTGLARPRNLDFVREMGADEALDHTTIPLAALGAFDVILDAAGTRHRELRGLLAPGGRMVAIAFDTAHIARSLGYIAASAVHGTGRVRFFSGNPFHDMYAELTQYVESGTLRPVVDTVHPLSAVAEAHRALEAGGVRGKHVIQIV
ncbi:NAD(P)-dependent alcohol dehydrogenase [Spongiactinospora sp. TRM90649]|uniref:NAD(P)-dependent alcohol dehydrogenase n=1 Tax=Spongiactinospora sp. TRM90649 TaxID=3031114 RepID=UPI0023F62CD2|nr:NAD(P)-dependent alcohol dehydrogenase [Spongiactinospora sp. TRM90649]MDF5757698.1 NAD(P)-dependent alcohol dehydrogenase [Spongiactinospora sp. TRM90649]